MKSSRLRREKECQYCTVRKLLYQNPTAKLQIDKQSFLSPRRAPTHPLNALSVYRASGMETDIFLNIAPLLHIRGFIDIHIHTTSIYIYIH